MRHLLAAGLVSLTLATCTAAPPPTPEVQMAAAPRRALPVMAWDHKVEARRWTRAGLDAVATHGQALTATLPADIGAYCPGYATATDDERAAFWVGMISALAKHESTWRADAVGGGGQWFGLTQISPATALGYGCKAQSGAALLNGAANVSCAVRIAAAQVGRDGYLVRSEGGWRGMGRDWAPFRSAAKRAEMAAFTSRQAYCR